MPLVVLFGEAKTYHSDKNLNHTLSYVASLSFNPHNVARMSGVSPTRSAG